MNWRAVNFDWNRARAFLVTAEEGSLSAAARALGVAQPTLGRQVSALEDELGVVLFERVGRGLALTPSGLELLDHVRAMGEAAWRVSLAAGGQSQTITGTVSITANEIYSAFLLPPIVQKLRRETPGIEIQIIASNTAMDLRRREADIAIRNFRPTEPDLIATRLKDDSMRLYASTRYLKRIGNPRTPQELSGAEFIGFDRSDVLLNALNSVGLKLTRANFPVLTGSHLVHWEMVKQGLGVGVAPERVGDAEPRVRRAIPGLAPLAMPVWLTTHRELRTSRRIRMVYDLLGTELAS
ncbi:MAG: LysR family transcriptional regulator [Myxococcaceae bacterium]